MAILLTDGAAQRVQKLVAKDSAGVGIRVGIKRTGCSGMAYTFEIAHDIAAGDAVFEHNGAQIIVAQEYMTYLDGALLDYVREGLKEGFKFTNPKEKAACGCGESVSF